MQKSQRLLLLEKVESEIIDKFSIIIYIVRYFVRNRIYRIKLIKK